MVVPWVQLSCYGSLPLESCDCVQMADGDSKSVGGVEWLRRLRKFE